MDGLFPGEPGELPAVRERIEAGVVTYEVPGPPEPPPVRHAAGYGLFVEYVAGFGITPEALLDTWTFAHVLRAHREALMADPALQRSAVVLLGNAFIANHAACVWTNHVAQGLGVETEGGRTSGWHDGVPVLRPGWARIGVEGTVQALLDADEERFAGFARTVDRWGWSGPLASAVFPSDARDPPVHSGPIWTIRSDDPPPPLPVRHATGYEPFVLLALEFGTSPAALTDTWRFAHFVRAHREALGTDPDLRSSAVLFLGNAFIARDPAPLWTHRANGLAVGTVPGPVAPPCVAR